MSFWTWRSLDYWDGNFDHALHGRHGVSNTSWFGYSRQASLMFYLVFIVSFRPWGSPRALKPHWSISWNTHVFFRDQVTSHMDSWKLYCRQRAEHLIRNWSWTTCAEKRQWAKWTLDEEQQFYTALKAVGKVLSWASGTLNENPSKFHSWIPGFKRT